MAVNINVPSQVKTYANLAAFPATGALKTIYIAEDTNKTYRWTGSVYTEISASAAMTWGAIGGTLSNQTDLQSALDAKVPTSRTLTINGVTQDLSANRTFTISTGITIGSTAIASGVVGRVLFEGAGNVVQESSSLFWDNTNERLGIGTSSPTQPLTVNGRALIGTATNIGSGTTLTALQVSAIGTAPIQILSDSSKVFGLTYEYNSAATSFYIFSDYYSGAVEPKLTFGTYTNRANQLVLNKTGNIGINTTTDAGFKLDVNGTARVATNLTVSTAGSGNMNTFLGGSVAIGNDWVNDGYILKIKANNTGVAGIYSRAGGASGYPILFCQDANGTTSTTFIVRENGNVIIGATTNIASSKLTIESTTQGFLPPRMTTTQKNAIASPATGLQVYDTTLNRPCFYDGTTWITL